MGYVKKITSELVCVCLVLVFSLTACQGTKKTEAAIVEKWSVKMADAVITRFDSLYQYEATRVGKWQYDNAMLGVAINKLADVNPKYAAYNKGFFDFWVQSDGSILHYKESDYNLDMINPGKSLFELYKTTKDKKYLATINLLVRQLESQPETSEGGYWHKKRYFKQMWLDGIYMSSPWMAQYAKEFNKPEWFDVVFKQITLIYQKTYDPATGLCYHAWDESKSERWCNPKTGQARNFWGRAMGWYMMAMVDALDYIPENYSGRDSIITIFQDVSAALANVRDPETGLWYQVLDRGGDEGNYLEASGSSMFVYAYAKGVKNGYLDKSYLDMANKSFDSMLEKFIITDKDGLPTLTWVCAAAGLGGKPYRDGSYDYYINERKKNNDSKGVGPFILAAIELDR